MLRRSSALACLLVLASCRTSLEETEQAQQVCQVGTSAACMQAVNESSIAWIETNVFQPSCTFSGCHNGEASAAGRLDLKKPGAARAALVDVESAIEPGRKLVVPGMPRQSYLMMIMQHYAPEQMDPPMAPPPDDIGYMPQGTDNVPVCCQKLDAVERWITAGAMP